MLLRAVAVSFSLCILFVGLQQLTAEEIGWRYDGTGHFPVKQPPRTWSTEENVIWKTKLPGRSLASPVVVGDRVFVTANPAELVCVSASDGKLLWSKSHGYHDVFGREKGAKIDRDHAKAEELRKQIGELNRQRRDANEAGDESKKQQLQQQISKLEQRVKELHAYPPPSDGEPGNTGPTALNSGNEVFALFGTGVVSSHSLDGEQNWMAYVEAGDSKQTASPLLVDNKLIVHLRHLTALDRATGETLWQTETSSKNGSPVVATIDGTKVVITPSGAIVRVNDGKLLARDQFRLDYASPLVHGDMLFAMEEGSIKAFQLTLEQDEGDRKSLPIVWESKSSRTKRLASPVYHEGMLYGATEQGILEVTEAATGKQIYRKRLDFDRGRADPSICVAGGLIYLSSNRGTTIVMQPGRDYNEVASNQLVDFSSSLAFAGSRLYVRAKNELWCIGK